MSRRNNYSYDRSIGQSSGSYTYDVDDEIDADGDDDEEEPAYYERRRRPNTSQVPWVKNGIPPQEINVDDSEPDDVSTIKGLSVFEDQEYASARQAEINAARREALRRMQQREQQQQQRNNSYRTTTPRPPPGSIYGTTTSKADIISEMDDAEERINSYGAGRKSNNKADLVSSDIQERKRSNAIGLCMVLIIVLVAAGTVVFFMMTNEETTADKTSSLNNENVESNILLRSGEPTSFPTQEPTTLEPTDATVVIDDPTTLTPVDDSSTNSPTLAPVVEPTLSPTDPPSTLAPVVDPTLLPTDPPSTLAPSSMDPTTIAPVIEPTTLAPTGVTISICQQVPQQDGSGCSICGEGKCVSKPDAIFSFPDQPTVPCGLLEFSGFEGFLELDQCAQLANLIGDVCGCIERGAAPVPVVVAPPATTPTTPPPSTTTGGGSCPSVPPDGCSVCGEGKCMTNPSAIFRYPGQQAVRCDALQGAGYEGIVTSTQCEILPPLISDVCGCVSSATAPPPPAVSPTTTIIAPSSCPEVPSNGCSVCGEGKCISNLDAIFESPGQPSVSCSLLQTAGYAGLVPLDECGMLPPFLGVCECV